MNTITRWLSRIFLLSTIILATSACTTTTTKLTTTKKPVEDSAGQLNEARKAFDEQNYGKAASLLTPLAEQGDASAQYALGYMYHNGLGVPRNYKLAIQWMTAASAKGNEKATEALRLISELGSDVTDNNSLVESNQIAPEHAEPIMISGKKPEPEVTPETVPTDTPSATSAESTIDPGLEQKPETAVLTEAPPKETVEPEKTAEAELTDSEKWIMEQSDQQLTIQLIATSNEAQMKRFIEENNLGNNLNSKAVYYRTMRNNKDWYTLIQGSYETPSAAREAIDGLPHTLQDLKPWVRSFANVKKALSNR